MVAYLVATVLTGLVVSFVRAGGCKAQVIRFETRKPVVVERRYINGKPRLARMAG